MRASTFLSCLFCALLFSLSVHAEELTLDNYQTQKKSAKEQLDEGYYVKALKFFRKALKLSGVQSKDRGNDLYLAVECLSNLDKIEEAETLVRQFSVQYSKDWRAQLQASYCVDSLQSKTAYIADQWQRVDEDYQNTDSDSHHYDNELNLYFLEQGRRAIGQTAPTDKSAAQFLIHYANQLMLNGKDGLWGKSPLTIPSRELLGDETASCPIYTPRYKDGKLEQFHVRDSFADCINDGERCLLLLEQAAHAEKTLSAVYKADFYWHIYGIQHQPNKVIQAIRGDGLIFETKKHIQDLGNCETLYVNNDQKAIVVSIPTEANYIEQFEQLLKSAPAEMEMLPSEPSESVLKSLKTTVKNFVAARLFQIYGVRNKLSKALEMEQNYSISKDTFTKFRYRFDTTSIANILKQDINLTIQYAGAPQSLELRLIRIPTASAFLTAAIKHKSSTLLDVASDLCSPNNYTFRNFKPIPSWVQSLWTKKIDFKDSDCINVKKTTVTIPRQHSHGTYFLTVTSATDKEPSITSIAYTEKLAIGVLKTNPDYLLTVFDRYSGKIQTEISLELVRFIQNKAREVTDVTQLDATLSQNGIFHIAADKLNDEKPNNRRTWYVRALDKNKKVVAVSQIYVSKPYPEPEPVRIIHTTDRPVYKPGETVNIQFWARLPDYIDSPLNLRETATDLKIEIEDPMGNTSLINDLKFSSDNSDNSFSVAVKLSENAKLGEYSFNIDSKKFYHSSPYGSFRVEEYVKPGFKISHSRIASPITPGSAQKFRFCAKHFDDAAVQGTASVRVYTRPKSWNDFDDNAPDASPNLQFGDNDSDQKKRLITQLKPEIGKDGTFEVTVNVPFECQENNNFTLEVIAEVRDLTQSTVICEAPYAVKPNETSFDLDLSTWVFAETSDVQIDLQCNATAKQIEVAQLSVELWRLSDGKEKVLHTLTTPVKIQPKPGVQTLNFGRLPAGVWHARLKSNAKYIDFDSPTPFAVYGENLQGLEHLNVVMPLFAMPEVVAPKQNFVELLILARQTNSQIVITTQQGSAPAKTQIITTQNRQAKVKLELNGSLFPMTVIAQFAKPGFHSSNSIGKWESTVTPSLDFKRLNLNLSTTRKIYKPRSAVELTLTATTGKAQPFTPKKPAYACITVYDQRLEKIQPFTPEFDFIPSDINGLNPPRMPFFASPQNQHEIWSIRYSNGNIYPFASFLNSKRIVRDYNNSWGAGYLSFGDEEGSSNAVSKKPTQIRKLFSDAVFWKTDVKLNDNGTATVKFNLPDSLTTWRARAWIVTSDNEIGKAQASFVSKQDYSIKLSCPEYLIEQDQLTVTATVQNSSPKSLSTVPVSLNLENASLQHLKTQSTLTQTIETLKAGESKLITWQILAAKAGTCKITVSCSHQAFSDAEQRSIEVLVHGAPIYQSFSERISAEQTNCTLEFTIPEKRKKDSQKLTLKLNGSYAHSMMQAIPYLLEYPYGCSEQTLNKFLPLVLAKRALNRLGLKLEDLKPDTESDTIKLRDKTSADRASVREALYDSKQADEMAKAGLATLLSMQNAGGSYSWFDGGKPSPYLSTIVTRGLILASQSGMDTKNAIDSARDYLAEELKSEMEAVENYKEYQQALEDAEPGETVNPNDFRPMKSRPSELDAFMAMVLAMSPEPTKRDQDADEDKGEDEGEDEYDEDDNWVVDDYCLEVLKSNRKQLGLYGLICYATACAEDNYEEELKSTLELIEQYLHINNENQTAFLKNTMKNTYSWQYDQTEMTALLLRLLICKKPDSKYIPGLLKYLTINRQHGTYWNSTRDTALCIEAFSEFICRNPNHSENLSFEIKVDGTIINTTTVSAKDLMKKQISIEVPTANLETGNHKVEIRKIAGASLNVTGILGYFSFEDKMPAHGIELKIKRNLWRMSRDIKTSANGERTERWVRNAMSEDTLLKPGEIVEVELIVESANDYEYILLEDERPAALQRQGVRSGWSDDYDFYREFRRNRTVFFMERLTRGKHLYKYRLRVQRSGKFTALPCKISAAYFPDLKGQSTNLQLTVN